MAILGSATYKLDTDNSRLNRGLARAEQTAKERSRRIAGNFAKIGTAGVAMGAAVGFALFKLGGQASDLNESINAVNVVFGQGARTILEFSRNTSTAVGLASADFNQLSASTGSLFTLYGLSEKEAAAATIDLTKRAADLASVFNTDVKDALFALQSGIRGETEPLRRFAADVTDASLELFLLEKGINRSVTEMTQAEKGLLRYEVAMAQTVKVEGDFRNTATSSANATRILRAQIKDAAAMMGQGLLPVFEAVLPWVQSVVSQFSEWAERNPKLMRALVLGAAAVAALTMALGAVLLAISAIIFIAPAAAVAWALIFGPVGLATLAIAGLIIGLGLLLWWKWDEFKAIWEGVKTQWKEDWDTIETNLIESWALIKALWDGDWTAVAEESKSWWERTRIAWQEEWDKISAASQMWWGSLKDNSKRDGETIKTAALWVWNDVAEGWEEEWTNDILPPLKKAWGGIKVAWNFVFDPLKTAAMAIWDGLELAWGIVWGGISGAATSVWDALVVAWNFVFDPLKTAAMAIWDGLELAWGIVWGGIKGAATSVWDALVVAWNFVFDPLKTAALAIWGGLELVWGIFWGGISGAATSVWDALVVAWDTVIGGLKTAALAIWGGLELVWGIFWGGISGAATSVWDALVVAWDTVIGGLKTAALAIWGGLELVWGIFWGGISGAATAVWDALVLAWNTVIGGLKTAALAIWGGLETAWSTVWGLIKGAATTVWDALVLAWNTVIGPLKTGIETIWDGINAVWDTAWGGMKTTVSDALNVIIGWINKLIDAWNNISFRIPTISLPSVTLGGGSFLGVSIPSKTIGGGTLGGETFSTPNISRIPILDEGAVVTGPTIAGLAMNNRPEAVVPLDRRGGLGLTVQVYMDGATILQADDAEQYIVEMVDRAVRRGVVLGAT